MAELWHLRIHLPEGISGETFYTFLGQRCEVIICVFEQHDNRPHLHILFKESGITKSTIIQNLLKKYPMLKGNGCYSCSKTDKMKKKKVGDDEKAKAYVCKGESNTVMPIVIGLCKIDVKAYHTKYWEVNAEIMEKVNMDCQNGSFSVLKAKSKTKTWTEKVCEDIIHIYEIECNTICAYYADAKPSELLFNQYKESHKILFLYFFKCMGKGAKKMNENILRDMFAGIINYITEKNDVANAGYGSKLYKGLYPNYS